MLTQAIDETRKSEVHDQPALKGTRYVFLKRLDAMTQWQRAKFELVNHSNTRTAKAWKMRENLLEVYECRSYEEAKSYFERWYQNVIHSNIKAMKRVAKTLQRYMDGILHHIAFPISNARAEQANSKIAKLQRMAQGYSNFQNLRAAILFFNGNLDLFSHN